jgi:hypothetical protein
MEIKIQPIDVRRRNARLVGLAIVLSIPFYCWVFFMTDLDHVPRWLPITVLSLNMGVVIPALVIARRYMNRRNGVDKAPTAETATTPTKLPNAR